MHSSALDSRLNTEMWRQSNLWLSVAQHEFFWHVKPNPKVQGDHDNFGSRVHTSYRTTMQIWARNEEEGSVNEEKMVSTYWVYIFL
jgi:hypothetical protein